MMTNTLTGLTLGRLNVRVATCASRMNPVHLRRGCATCSLSLVRAGPIHYPSPTGTGRVRRLVFGVGKRKSAVKKIIAYIIGKYPVKLKRPMFNGLRTTLKTTVLDVGTTGTFRCKSNFGKLGRGNSRRGSIFCGGGKHVRAHAGRSNNVRNKVDGKRSVCFHMTFGPITAMLVRRRAIGVSNMSAALGTQKHRSPYMLPHTMPVIRTVTTVALLSCCLVSEAARLWCSPVRVGGCVARGRSGVLRSLFDLVHVPDVDTGPRCRSSVLTYTRH